MKTVVFAMDKWARTYAGNMWVMNVLYVKPVYNSDECLAALVEGPVDAFVIDLRLLAPSGVPIHRCYRRGNALYMELRRRGYKCPIILLGNKDVVVPSLLRTVGADVSLGLVTRIVEFDPEAPKTAEELRVIVLSLLQ